MEQSGKGSFSFVMKTVLGRQTNLLIVRSWPNFPVQLERVFVAFCSIGSRVFARFPKDPAILHASSVRLPVEVTNHDDDGRKQMEQPAYSSQASGRFDDGWAAAKLSSSYKIY